MDHLNTDTVDENRQVLHQLILQRIRQQFLTAPIPTSLFYKFRQYSWMCFTCLVVQIALIAWTFKSNDHDYSSSAYCRRGRLILECTLPFRDRIPIILCVLLSFDIVVFVLHIHLVYTIFGRFLRTIMGWGNFDFLSEKGVARMYVIFFLSLGYEHAYIAPLLENWLFFVSLLYHNHDRFAAYTVLKAICSESTSLLKTSTKEDDFGKTKLAKHGLDDSTYNKCKNMSIIKAEIMSRPMLIPQMNDCVKSFLELGESESWGLRLTLKGEQSYK